MAVRHSYQLSGKYWVTFRLEGNTLDAAWSPTPPKKKHLQRLLPSYQAARHAFLSKLGLNVLVVEL